jgi:hypothetical protein
MSVCIEEHYKKYSKDYQVIKLLVYGHPSYSEWVEILHDQLK